MHYLSKTRDLTFLLKTEPGNTSLVSSCNGSSPYNTLVPECADGQTAVQTDSYTMVARDATCPQRMDTYRLITVSIVCK